MIAFPTHPLALRDMLDAGQPLGLEDRLPARPLTAEERHGFRIACAMLETWGRRISGAGVSLSGSEDPVPMREVMARSGRMVTGCAQALALAADRL
jgi:hypothetical protein